MTFDHVAPVQVLPANDDPEFFELLRSTTSIPLDLHPLDGTTGTVRTNGELDPVATAFKSAGFRVTVREVAIVHGYYTGETPQEGTAQPASLLVYLWELNGGDAKDVAKGRKIHAIDIKLRFERSPLASPKDDPYIQALFPAPDNRGFKFGSQGVEKVENEGKGVGGSVKGGAAGASLGFSGWFAQQVSKSYSVVEYGTCTSKAIRTEGRGGGRVGEDEVTWTLADNGSTTSLPDVFTTAVVVGRPAGALGLKVIFNIEAVVDRAHDWAIKFAKIKKSMPWNNETKHSKVYSVSETAKVPELLKDKNHLRNEVLNFGLQKYFFFHQPEQQEPKAFFTSLETGKSAGQNRKGNKREEEGKKEGREEGKQAQGGGAGEGAGKAGGDEQEEKDKDKDKDEGKEQDDEDEDDDVFEDALDTADLEPTDDTDEEEGVEAEDADDHDE